MPVRRATAYNLLQVFGQLEFELKRIPRFVGIGRNRSAKADWSLVEQAAGQLPPPLFLDRISVTTRDKLLGGARNRPMVQVVDVVNGANMTRFEVRGLPHSDSEALVAAMRRVRNNLFHGGKEDPLEEPYPGDDQEWATAALEVAQLLLDLVRRGRL